MTESERQHLAQEIVRLAFLLAIDAPPQQGRYSTTASVSWELIHQLRDKFREAGFDPDRRIREAYEICHKRKCPRIGRPPARKDPS